MLRCRQRIYARLCARMCPSLGMVAMTAGTTSPLASRTSAYIAAPGWHGCSSRDSAEPLRRHRAPGGCVATHRAGTGLPRCARCSGTRGMGRRMSGRGSRKGGLRMDGMDGDPCSDLPGALSLSLALSRSLSPSLSFSPCAPSFLFVSRTPPPSLARSLPPPSQPRTQSPSALPQLLATACRLVYRPFFSAVTPSACAHARMRACAHSRPGSGMAGPIAP